MEKGNWGFKENFKMVDERNRGKKINSLRKNYGNITHVAKELGAHVAPFLGVSMRLTHIWQI
jgi:hypothetical protein